MVQPIKKEVICSLFDNKKNDAQALKKPITVENIQALNKALDNLKLALTDLLQEMTALKNNVNEIKREYAVYKQKCETASV